MPKEIKLKHGIITIVDEQDFELLNKHKWYFNQYVRRGIIKNGKKTAELMHRIIMNCPHGLEIDHINHDTLDNRRENLRICTPSQNKQNRTYKKSIVGVKGIGFHKASKKWRVRVSANKNKIDLGLFNTIEEAIKAYNFAVIKYHGEFARQIFL